MSRITIYSTRLDLLRTVELVKERTINYAQESSVMDCPERVVELMQYVFDAGSKAQEFLWVVALNGARRVQALYTASQGTLTASLVHPREVFTPCLLCGNVASLILVHNHPSGQLDISEQDRDVSSRIRQAGEILGIHLDDHLIIAGDSFVSCS